MMNETQLTSESDEIADSTSFSIVAIVGLILSLVGTLSVIYKNVLPYALIGTVLGMFVLITAKYFNLNYISRTLGFLAVVIGAVFASWGMFYRQLTLNEDLQYAKAISKQYLDSLSEGKIDNVLYLVGFQLEGESAPTGEVKQTEAERAKKRLLEDDTHVEIRSRRNPAKWVYAGLETQSMGTVGYTYKLRFRDEGQTNPPTYFVYARKNCKQFDDQETVRWFVDSLDSK